MKALRISLIAFFWCGILFGALIVPRAIRLLIEKGTDYPKFWPYVLVTTLVAIGVLVGGVVMTYVTKIEIQTPLRKQHKDQRDGT
jgi:hypothetical protein